MEKDLKNALIVTPCGPSGPCSDYDDCESGDDITEKDLANLLNEEKNRIQSENEKKERQAEFESQAIKAQNERQKKKGLKDSSDAENDKKGLKDSSDAENDKKELKDSLGVKKKPCRKIIKNPFYTNRLTFSSDLPLRPPVPPPQFLPLAGEDENAKVCPKRKKKCKKNRGSKSKCAGTDKTCDEDEDECEGGGEGGGECGEGGEGGGEGGGEDACETEPCDCRCDEQPECCKPKRRCKKNSEKSENRGPCRKKPSDISIPPQPRRIPLLLKDLPSICPKDIPEVERQILMSRENEVRRNSCKKKCKKKEKVEELLNQ